MCIIGFDVYTNITQKAAFSWVGGQGLWKTEFCVNGVVTQLSKTSL